MSQRNNVAQIEGSLNALDYDDSSDDEKDEQEEEEMVDSVVIEDDICISYDKDEEELEIFSKTAMGNTNAFIIKRICATTDIYIHNLYIHICTYTLN